MDDSPSPTLDDPDVPPSLPSYDIMNEPDFTPPQREDTASTQADSEGNMSHDTCRICRDKATREEPLFFPCKCSGSIKYVHQECLMDWLAHSHKKHCELCKTPFRFTKLYDANMPMVLPWAVFLRTAATHFTVTLLRLCRGLLVGAVWLVALPWVIRWAWRWMFWFADVEWAGEAFLQMLHTNQSVIQADASVSGTPKSNDIYDTLASLFDTFVPTWQGSNSTLQNSTTYANQSIPITYIPSLPQADASVLSSWTYISELTSDNGVNRLILDVFEGQLITCVVITGFILVFLIREWVVQQQPLVNLDNLNMEERERDRQQRQQDRIRQHHTDIRPPTQVIAGPVEEQTSRLAEAFGQLPRQGEPIVRFAGWDSLNSMMDEANNYLSIPGDIGSKLFRTSASAVMAQIRAAHNVTLNEREVATMIYRKLATYSDEHRLRWERVIDSVLLQNVSLPYRLDRDTVPNAADQPESSTNVRETQIPEPEWSHNTLQSRRSTEDSETPSNNLDRLALLESALNDVGDISEIDSSSTDSPVSTSTSSWQHLSLPKDEYPVGRSLGATFEQDVIPITNAGPDAKINIKRRKVTKVKLVLEVKDTSVPQQQGGASSASSNPEVGSQSTVEVIANPAVNAAPRQENGAAVNANPVNPDGPNPEQPEPESLRARMANAFREEFGLDRDEDFENGPQQHQHADLGNLAEVHAEEVRDEAPPAVPPAPPRGILDPLADWFWGDIQPREPPPRPIPAPNEERINNDELNQQAPVMNEQPEVQHQEELPPLQQPPEAAELDPEAAIAAQQAGLDAQAIEDAEDLEGIFELIGFQGPLIGLLQTSCFCCVLVIGTVFAAVGLPYLGGKMVLLLVGNPVGFALKMPLQIGSVIADVLIDLTLLCGSWVAITLTLAATFFLSAIEVWMPKATNLDFTGPVAQFADTTATAAAKRLEAFFVSAGNGDKFGWNWAFLRASVSAHASLKGLQDEVRMVLSSAVNIITALADTLSTRPTFAMIEPLLDPVGRLFSVKAGVDTLIDLGKEYLQPILRTIVDLKTGSLKFESTKMPIDPSLVYWSTADRTLTVMTGYVALAGIAALYVALDTPITQSPAGRKTEKIVRDTLKQAGGVLKVILIISIEMLVFPLYCGLLLDFAFLPLFHGASMSTRLAFAVKSPYTFGFVHWFVGTCYMFHFALFVGMCRKILRRGVLWFIRDPDDPTFHPVRDVLERNVTTQLRKIAFSALVYGALVILCLGGVIWSIGHIFKGIFPVHWVSTEPVVEFPLDLLLYNLITPFVIRLFKPSDAVHSMYAWWLRRCARTLRLSHFLFNDQRKDEEDEQLSRAWTNVPSELQADMNIPPKTSHDTHDDNDKNSDTHSRHNGRYVLTPCNDQYRPPKPGEAFLVVDGPDMFIVDKDGKKNDHFAMIYVPPYFGARVTIFMICLWMFSVFAGLCATLVPLVLGRGLFAWLMPDVPQLNDVYAYSIGAYILGGISLLLFYGKDISSFVQGKLSAVEFRTWIVSVARYIGRVLKCVYVYSFFGLCLPTLCAFMLQFYLIIPLHTYMHSTGTAVQPPMNNTMDYQSGAANNGTNFTQFSGLEQNSSTPTFVNHTIHLLADYALGLLYLRIITRIIMTDPASRTVEAFRLITSHGYFSPDLWLTTRFFVLPTTLFALVVFGVPAIVAKVAIYTFDVLATNGDGGIILDETARMMLYRYSYPMGAGMALIFWGSMEVTKATSRWRSRIRDEVYLVGERLHNFGEKKPPTGSKSVIRKDRAIL